MNKKLILITSVLLPILGYFIFIHINIVSSTENNPEDADYLIVLGARVKGEQPSLSLQYRINTAAEYLTRNPETLVIASGGKGPGEDISEAEAIRRGLVEKGIKSERIVLESKSTSTYENILFSKQLIHSSMDKGLIVSNDYHLYRAKLIARDQGLSVTGLPANTPKISIVKSYSREYLAITKYFFDRYILSKFK